MAIKTAVILAAGLGSRLKDRTKTKPKGFVEIDNKAIVERSIEKLINAGITTIIIGTGYLSEHYDRLKDKYPQIITCRSSKYAETGSMFTLYNLRELVKEDFLLLESDLLYDRKGLKELIDDARPDIILASGKTGSNDEVYIEADNNHNLVNMSKKADDLAQIIGELVGISKISMPTFGKMLAYAETQFEHGGNQFHYENDFVGISVGTKIYVKKIENYSWCEIDDEDHLNRALTLVYPRIIEAESLDE